MAEANVRNRKHLQMLKLPVIMQFQDQPLPQPPNTIHNAACAPFQAITFGDAFLVCSSSMHPLIHLINFEPVYRAQQQLKLWHARDLSSSFCTSCSLTLFYPAKFLADSLNFSQVMYPFLLLCGVTRRNLQTPGIPTDHRRQETPTINPMLCGVSDDRCICGLLFPLAICWLHGCMADGFVCASVVVVLGDAWPLSLSPCDTSTDPQSLRTRHNAKGQSPAGGFIPRFRATYMLIGVLLLHGPVSGGSHDSCIRSGVANRYGRC